MNLLVSYEYITFKLLFVKKSRIIVVIELFFTGNLYSSNPIVE